MELLFRGCVTGAEIGTYGCSYIVVNRGLTCKIDSNYFDNFDIFKKGDMVEIYENKNVVFGSSYSIAKLGRVREERYWK